MTDLLKPALIFLGAGTGGLLRYWLGGLFQLLTGPTFPIGTMLVNITGCLVMGFLATAWEGSVMVSSEYKTLVLIGVLGGYTTFSSFGKEALALAHDGEWLYASFYVLGSVIIGLLAVWIGAMIAGKLYGTGAP